MAVALSAPTGKPGKNVAAGKTKATGSPSTIHERKNRNKSTVGVLSLTDVAGLPIASVTEIPAKGVSAKSHVKNAKNGNKQKKVPGVTEDSAKLPGKKGKGNKTRSATENKGICKGGNRKKVDNSTRLAIESFKVYYETPISNPQPFAEYIRQLMDIVKANKTNTKPSLIDARDVAREVFEQALNGKNSFRNPNMPTLIKAVRKHWNEHNRSQAKVGQNTELAKNFISEEPSDSNKQMKVAAVLCLLQNTLQEVCSPKQTEPEDPCKYR